MRRRLFSNWWDELTYGRRDVFVYTGLILAVVASLALYVYAAHLQEVECHNRGGELYQSGTVSSTSYTYDGNGNITGSYTTDLPVFSCTK